MGDSTRSESESDPIVLGTPAWYDWLEQHTAFTFVDQISTFKARKSMLRTGGSYWKAYYRRQGKLYRMHLGHSLCANPGTTPGCCTSVRW